MGNKLGPSELERTASLVEGALKDHPNDVIELSNISPENYDFFKGNLENRYDIRGVIGLNISGLAPTRSYTLLISRRAN